MNDEALAAPKVKNEVDTWRILVLATVKDEVDTWRPCFSYCQE
jgi:hypothetical protein